MISGDEKARREDKSKTMRAAKRKESKREQVRKESQLYIDSYKRKRLSSAWANDLSSEDQDNVMELYKQALLDDHKTKLSETYPKEYSKIYSYELDFDDDDDLQPSDSNTETTSTRQDFFRGTNTYKPESSKLFTNNESDRPIQKYERSKSQDPSEKKTEVRDDTPPPQHHSRQSEKITEQNHPQSYTEQHSDSPVEEYEEPNNPCKTSPISNYDQGRENSIDRKSFSSQKILKTPIIEEHCLPDTSLVYHLPNDRHPYGKLSCKHCKTMQSFLPYKYENFHYAQHNSCSLPNPFFSNLVIPDYVKNNHPPYSSYECLPTKSYVLSRTSKSDMSCESTEEDDFKIFSPGKHQTYDNRKDDTFIASKKIKRGDLFKLHSDHGWINTACTPSPFDKCDTQSCSGMHTRDAHDYDVTHCNLKLSGSFSPSEEIIGKYKFVDELNELHSLQLNDDQCLKTIKSKFSNKKIISKTVANYCLDDLKFMDKPVDVSQDSLSSGCHVYTDVDYCPICHEVDLSCQLIHFNLEKNEANAKCQSF